MSIYKWCLQLKRETVGLSPVEEGRSVGCVLQGDALGGWERWGDSVLSKRRHAFSLVLAGCSKLAEGENDSGFGGWEADSRERQPREGGWWGDGGVQMWLLWFGKRSWKWGLCVDDRAVGEGRKMRDGLLLSRLQGELKEVRGWSWIFGWGEGAGREVVCREEMRAAALFFKRENGGLFLLVGRGEPVDVVWGKRDRGGRRFSSFLAKWGAAGCLEKMGL